MSNKNDHFSLARSTTTRKMPAPGSTNPTQPGGSAGKGGVLSDFKLTPEHVTAGIHCVEIILKAQARCAEIRAMSEAEIRKMDKEIEMIQVKTDNYIKSLQAQGKAMDEARERIMQFGKELKALNYPESVQLALIAVFQETIKAK